MELTWQGVVRVYRVRRHLYDVGYFPDIILNLAC